MAISPAYTYKHLQRPMMPTRRYTSFSEPIALGREPDHFCSPHHRRMKGNSNAANSPPHAMVPFTHSQCAAAEKKHAIRPSDGEMVEISGRAADPVPTSN